jgi:hypothetical protein
MVAVHSTIASAAVPSQELTKPSRPAIRHTSLRVTLRMTAAHALLQGEGRLLNVPGLLLQTLLHVSPFSVVLPLNWSPGRSRKEKRSSQCRIGFLGSAMIEAKPSMQRH